MVVKFHVLTKCEFCQGQAYLFVGEAEDFYGQKYDRYKPCPNCEGSGTAAKWVALAEFRQLVEQSESPHQHVSKEVARNRSTITNCESVTRCINNSPVMWHFLISHAVCLGYTVFKNIGELFGFENPINHQKKMIKTSKSSEICGFIVSC